MLEKDLAQLGQDADIGDVTPADLQVHRWITGCSDTKLQGKFLREAQPTIATLTALACQHEAAAETLKGIDKEKQQAASASQAKGKGKDGGSKDSNSRNSRKDGGKKKRTCWKCGKNHRTEECPKKKEDLKCTDCGKVGHLAVVCGLPDREREKARARSKSKGGGGNSKDGGGKGSKGSPPPSYNLSLIHI